MTINVYDVGDLVTVSGAFTDVAGLPADPATVSLAFVDPSGNVTTYLYLTDVQVVKDSTGNYHVDVNADEAGDWHYRWIATGTGQGAQLGQFAVKPRQVGP